MKQKQKTNDIKCSGMFQQKLDSLKLQYFCSYKKIGFGQSTSKRQNELFMFEIYFKSTTKNRIIAFIY